MPGYVMHLAVAEKIIRQCRIIDKKYINEFVIGSIVPDAVERNDKRYSHFWDDDTYGKFERKPNLEMFLAKYKERLCEPYVFGYYCHLYLDRQFMDRYWSRHFKFYDDSMEAEEAFDLVTKVLLTDNNTVYGRAEFFSDKYYYGDYDRLNPYILKKYEVQTPELVVPEHEIDEISVNVVKESLRKRLEMVTHTSMSDAYEDVRVFNVADFEKLMDDTSKELCECYMSIVRKMQ